MITKGNFMALIFPLFTQQMFAGMTYQWGLTLWALLSVAMAPIPWVCKPTYVVIDGEVSKVSTFFMQVLLFFGSKIRSRSKVSRKILEAEQQRLDGEKTVVSSPTEERSMQA
jgi:hypothetical protein